jgi:hypothetical protein
MNAMRQKNRGRRECRAPDAPVASCAKVESTRVRNHGHTGSTRHSLRNGFNGFLRALLGDEFLLSPSSADMACRTRSGRLRLRRLSISNGCQDHTTSPSAKASFVCTHVNRSQTFVRPAITSARRRCRVHRIPFPTSVTIASRPSLRERDDEGYEVIWSKRKREYFCKRGWTGNSVICPSGARSQEIPSCQAKVRSVFLLRCPGNPSSFGGVECTVTVISHYGRLRAAKARSVSRSRPWVTPMGHTSTNTTLSKVSEHMAFKRV